MADVMRSGPAEDPYDDEPFAGEPEESGRRSRRRRSEKRSFLSFLLELLILVVTALVLTTVIQAFLGRIYVIPSESMEQTLHGCTGCTNDRVLVDKISYRFADPEPGDVVVFRGPQPWVQAEFTVEDPANPIVGAIQSAASVLGFGAPNEKDFVKRVIAVGGQTVQCCDEQNRVLVDGKPLSEPYIYWEPGRGEQQEEFAPVTVPQGTLWVMGDNRNNSSDSRMQGGGGVNGTVPLTDVIGKAQVIVMPVSRWQSIAEPNPQADALGAPAWQQGAPLGIGLAAAFPTVWLGRRLTGVARRRPE